MIQEWETIEGPIGPTGPHRKFLVVFAGVKRADGSQRVRARRQSEGVGGALVETEISLVFPDPDNIEPWRVIRP